MTVLRPRSGRKPSLRGDGATWPAFRLVSRFRGPHPLSEGLLPEDCPAAQIHAPSFFLLPELRFNRFRRRFR
jgi:hypothetical protein